MFDVGKRIKELREQRGYTVNKLANLAGISQSYLREIELGNKQPTVAYLEYICFGLKVSLVEFFNTENLDIESLDTIMLRLTPKQQKKLIEFIKTI